MSVKTQRPFSFCTAFIEPFLFEWTNDPIWKVMLLAITIISLPIVFLPVSLSGATFFVRACFLFFEPRVLIFLIKGEFWNHTQKMWWFWASRVSLSRQSTSATKWELLVSFLPKQTKYHQISMVTWDDWPAGKNLPRFLYSLVVVTCQNSINSIDSCSIIGEIYHPPRWF